MVGVPTKSVTHPTAFCNIAYISWIECCWRIFIPFTDISFIPTFNVAGCGTDNDTFLVVADDANILWSSICTIITCFRFLLLLVVEDGAAHKCIPTWLFRLFLYPDIAIRVVFVVDGMDEFAFKYFVVERQMKMVVIWIWFLPLKVCVRARNLRRLCHRHVFILEASCVHICISFLVYTCLSCFSTLFGPKKIRWFIWLLEVWYATGIQIVQQCLVSFSPVNARV